MDASSTTAAGESSWSPKRRKLSPAAEGQDERFQASAVHSPVAPLPAEATLDLLRPVRRNAHCLATTEEVQGHPSAIDAAAYTAGVTLVPPPTEPQRDSNASAGPASPTQLHRLETKPDSASEARECEEDDIEAATQRSILQELHEIQEESSQTLVTDGAGERPDTVVEQIERLSPSDARHSAAEPERQPDEADVKATVHPELPLRNDLALAHEKPEEAAAPPPFDEVATTDKDPSEVSPLDDEAGDIAPASRTSEAMPAPSQIVDEALPQLETSDPALAAEPASELEDRDAALRETPQPQEQVIPDEHQAHLDEGAAPVAPTSYVAPLDQASAPVTPSAFAGLIDEAADYSLLFEGLDADAFDDVDLSPVDPIKTARPPQSAYEARGPPSSPLVARKRLGRGGDGPSSEALQPERENTREATAARQEEDVDALFGSQSFDFDAIDEQGRLVSSPPIAPVAFQGFRTAANGKLTGPSDAAMKRAMRLVFSQSSQNASQSEAAAAAPVAQVTPARDVKGKGRQSTPSPPADDASASVVKTEDFDGFGGVLFGGAGGFAGFSNAKGVALRPSEAALAAAKRLFAEIDDEDNVHFTSRTPPPAADRSKRRPPQSADKLPHATAQTTAAVTPSAGDQGLNVSAVESGPGAESSAQSSTPRTATMDLPRTEEGGPAIDATVANASLDNGLVTVARPVQPLAAEASRRSEGMEAPRAPIVTTPLRPQPVPLQLQAGRQAAASPLRSARHAASAPVSTASAAAFGTPASQKRVSLGMTPRGNQKLGPARPKFRTPFKSGVAPSLPTSTSATAASSPLRTPLGPSRKANVVYPQPASQTLRPKALQKFRAGGGGDGQPKRSMVFDLTPRQPRQSLASSGIVPEGVSPLQAIARGVPDEVLVILSDSSKAALYAFDGPNGKLLGPQDALRTLHERGCAYADQRWVKNHWTLILWKMASLTRHRPDEASWRWSWDEVIRQLLYRYEREINRAQRSCVKRIQEHDSPPQLPMVLFVARILESNDQGYDEDGGSGVAGPSSSSRREVTLELSDGWYRIRADIDGPLTDAVLRGRIRVGQKLAIVGARLQSSGDGTEVLDALLTSSLSLSANSVSLARWDARLGFSRQRFFASLRSLTPEGGVVAAMDVVITKVFPLAYIDADSDFKGRDGSGGGPGGGGARGEAEEHEAREAWLHKREETRAKLEARFDQSDRRLDTLLNALEAASSSSSGSASSQSVDSVSRQEDEAFSVFCSIEEHDDPIAALKTLVLSRGKSYLLPHLVAMVRSRLLAGGEESRYLLSSELERLCPPRRVRDFRVVRFRDARLAPPPTAPCTTNGGGVDSTATATATATAMGKKNPHARTVQLTVWYASALGEGLRVGARYVVTQLMPTQKRAWRRADEAAEVFLSTRRDTRWTPVGAVE